MNFFKSGKTVDESRAWLKRIAVSWVILNGLDLISTSVLGALCCAELFYFRAYDIFGCTVPVDFHKYLSLLKMKYSKTGGLFWKPYLKESGKKWKK